MSVAINGTGSITGIDQGFNVTTGSVGIGTDNPSRNLTVASGSSSGYIQLCNDASGTGSTDGFHLKLDSQGLIADIIHREDGPLRFWTDNTEKLRITSDGGVGIGTDDPSAYFSDANDIVLLKTDDCGITIASGASQKGTIAFADGTTGDQAYRGYIQYNHSTDSLQVATTGTERLRITSDGKVGIRTDAPKQIFSVVGRANFDLQGDYYGCWINGDSQGTSSFNVGAWHNAGGRMRNEGNHLVLETMNTSHWIQLQPSGGNISVGSNNPNGLLALTASSGRILTLRNSATGSASGDGSYLALNGTDFQIANAETANIIFYTNDTERLRLDDVGRLTITGQGLKLNPIQSSLYALDGSLSYYATNNGVYLNGSGTNGWLRLNASGAENNQNAINIFGGSAGAHIDMRTDNVERFRITSAGKIGINQSSPAGQVHIKGNTDESANPSIILDDNGDSRRCYVTNTSGDMMLGGIDNGTVQSRLTIHENGNIYHQRLNSSGALQYQFYANSSQVGGAASGNTYAEHMAFRPADGMKQGSFVMTIYGDGGDNYMPVLFIKHGYHPTNSSFGGQWFGEMWLNNAGSINPQNYNHTGYNNWATTSFKYRWDCAHWNAKPTMSIIEHYVNYGRPNIADLLISGTTSYFVMWILPGQYRVTYNAWDGLNAWWTNNNNVGGALTHREGGSNTTRAVMAYGSRDTRYDSNISWGTQGQT